MFNDSLTNLVIGAIEKKNASRPAVHSLEVFSYFIQFYKWKRSFIFDHVFCLRTYLMKELEAKQIISEIVDPLVPKAKVHCIKRDPVSRLESEYIFGVVFKVDETLEINVIKAIKDLSFSNPDFWFHGSDVDEKFDMDFVMIFVACKIKE